MTKMQKKIQDNLEESNNSNIKLTESLEEAQQARRNLEVRRSCMQDTIDMGYEYVPTLYIVFLLGNVSEPGDRAKRSFGPAAKRYRMHEKSGFRIRCQSFLLTESDSGQGCTCECKGRPSGTGQNRTGEGSEKS